MKEYLLYSILKNTTFTSNVYKWEIYPFEHFDEKDGTLIQFKIVYRDTKLLGVIVKNKQDKEVIKKIELGLISVPAMQKDYYKILNDVRSRKVTWVKSKGNSSKNSVSTKLYISKIWLDVMGVNDENRDLEMIFNGEEIRIRKM